MLFRKISTSLVLLGLFTVLTGLLYPLAVTGIAQIVFPERANGSLLVSREGEKIGSELIGQQFSDPKYFWSRPSATSPFAYNAAASSGSNYGPLHPALITAVKKRVDALRNADPQNDLAIPIDLVTASGSGLDPHISIAAALYQLPRIARIRTIDEASLHELINRYTEAPQLGFLGESRVNVLKLNLALDAKHIRGK